MNKLLTPLDSHVADLEIVSFLIQLDRLFTEDDFKDDEAKVLLLRLRSLNPRALKKWGQAIDNDPPQVAIMLIQEDLLFNQNQFQEAVLEKLLREQNK